MAEDYHRPPLLAREPPSRRAAEWRFRIAFTLLLAALVVGLFFLYRALTGPTGEGSPGIGAPAPVTVVGR